MGGVNPYIKSAATELPHQKFRIEFRAKGDTSGRSVEIDPSELPNSGTGLDGSILSMALAMDLEIDHACGGVSACSTCHVYIKQGLETCNPAEEAEEDMLDQAPGVGPQSRLACQCVPNGSKDLIVEIPGWNRNRVREGG